MRKIDLGTISCWKCTSSNVEIKKIRVGRERTAQEEITAGEEDLNIYTTFIVCKDCSYKFQPAKDSYLKQIVFNHQRNEKIADLVVRFILARQLTYVFVGLTQHAENLNQLIQTKLIIRGLNPELCKLVHGKLDDNEQTKKDFISHKVLAVVGTTVWSEGTNIRPLRWAIYAKAGLKGTELEQFVGRALRTDIGKFRTGIIDFKDTHDKEYATKSRTRQKFLKEKGFQTFALSEVPQKVPGRRRFLRQNDL